VSDKIERSREMTVATPPSLGKTNARPAKEPPPLLGARVLMLVQNNSVPFDIRVWRECRSLRDRGCDVVAVCPRGVGWDTEPFEEIEGIAIHRYAPGPSGGNVIGYLHEYLTALFRIWGLSRRLARERPFDAVHAANPPDLLLLAALPLKRRGAKFIFDHHDLGPELYEVRFGKKGPIYRASVLFERLSFRLADVVIATNESYRRIALRRGGKHPDDVFVVRNDPETRVSPPVQPDFELRRGRKHLIGYAGLMAAQDGVDHALRALAELKRKRHDWFAVFVGDGEAMPELRRLASDLDLKHDIEFTGWVDQAEVRSVLAACDICLAPEPKNPLTDASTMIKVAEYMELGRPVVAYGLSETRFSAGEAGIYAEPNDVASLASRIDELLEDPERRAEMAAVGRERVKRLFTWERSEAELLAAYRRALGKDAEP